MLNRQALWPEAHDHLHDVTARELMAPDPRSIDQSATVRQAAEFFCSSGLSGAPVIDEAGRPVGVLSRTDVLRHLMRGADGWPHWTRGTRSRVTASTPVKRVMTRSVFSVRPETPAVKAIAKLTALQVSRLFVVDRYGVLIGVISGYDVLRRFALPALPDEDERVDADQLASPALAS